MIHLLVLPAALAALTRAPQQSTGLGRPDPVPVLKVARPRDPWVFRCVLDQRPRMITLALSDELWVAYDATTCGLYKAWKGGVHFDGPVYTTQHGPQPTTRGASYTEGFEGDVWSVEIDGKEAPAKAIWRGYQFNGDHVALKYDLAVEGGRTIPVQESAEFVRPEDLFDPARMEELVLPQGFPGLMRSFLARGIPENAKVSLRLRSDAAHKLAETLERERYVDVVDANGNPRTQVISHLALTKAKPQSNLVLFFEPLPAPVDPEPATDATPGAKPAARTGAKPEAKKESR